MVHGMLGARYRVGSLTAAARELARYKLHLVDVQKVRWDNGGTVGAGDYNFLYGHLGDTGVNRMIILRWISRKWDVRVWTGSSCLRIMCRNKE